MWWAEIKHAFGGLPEKWWWCHQSGHPFAESFVIFQGLSNPLKTDYPRETVLICIAWKTYKRYTQLLALHLELSNFSLKKGFRIWTYSIYFIHLFHISAINVILMSQVSLSQL